MSWAVRKNAGWLIDDKCIWCSLCQFGCGEEKKEKRELLAKIATAQWRGWALQSTLSPCSCFCSKSCRGFSLHLHQSTQCRGVRPAQWQIGERMTTAISTHSNCCISHNKSKHLFDTLFLNVSNLLCEKKIIFSWASVKWCWMRQLHSNQGEYSLFVFPCLFHFFYPFLFQFPLLEGGGQNKN